MKKLMTTLGITVVFGALALPAIAQDADDDIPPPEVVASLTPVYFEGHPAYFWHNRWHYRDANSRWSYYRAEPQFLHDYRNGHRTEWHYAGGQHGGGGHWGGRR